MDYRPLLAQIHRDVMAEPLTGHVARYIPELARVDPALFSVSLHCLKAHETHSVGDHQVPLSIQSVVKVLLLVFALRSEGQDLWNRVGVEPSGTAFNSLILLEQEGGRPRNPCINAGALVVIDMICGHHADPAAAFLDFVRGLCDAPGIDYDSDVARSEKATGHRNVAMAHFLKSFGNLHHPVEEVLDFYFTACSLQMTTASLARAFSFLGRAGVSNAGAQVCTARQARRINAIMQTCGFYDEAGEFAFRVGLPGKSGVGGGIVAIYPGLYTVAAWSPPLNAKGNSVRATRALELLVERTGASVFGGGGPV